ncbi:MAG: UDP-N-acetylmuramate dehydrogenase [Candidatus Pacebacteria bacterium]|jgi:UDP-N-acetylmuramate dehydrogenase|nr:UDP-N-acetylmuramate dehydrogenase [Candidatus Paceibacterota bacterium]MDD2757021.1 UDP-N-acetylmuramate dehydrogenase [Candidatus Paceibacterota bacterium]MDD3283530.1 UDP-N-acetylmuramate dehydrogenase [Candidatus Paceibacterota bacterium]MDD3969613.1 UDP-N-acetylmuramate dehydrogenase [Candidatus Paceibacterota bacterium]MDD4737841.1 UDP-N-acetylmuramate dehydrogenase [Candidatus Paceibacterota bacterium]
MEGIKENVLLSKYSTFRIGGPARYLIEVSDPKDIKRAIEKALELNLKFLVIGGGSNILFSSEGYDGMVIVFNSSNNFLINDNLIEVNASISLNYLVNKLDSYTGLEWAIGIPGTLAGAINGNAGAFGVEISELIKQVKVLEVKNKKIIEREFSKKDCNFGYRNSIFKNNYNLIITSAILELEKGNTEEIKKNIKNNLSKRILKQPKGFSIGSIFKNGDNFSAGELIEKAGLKGKQIGDAKIAEDHANFIINLGNATSDDVLSLIKIIKKEVEEKFLIKLEEEIKIF